MTDFPPHYMAGVRLTLEVVTRYKAVVPRPSFRFPDPAILFVAPLDHVGRHLARNRTARELLAELLIEAKLRKCEPPTVLMLRAALEDQHIPVVFVEFAALKIPGQLVRMKRPDQDPPS